LASRRVAGVSRGSRSNDLSVPLVDVATGSCRDGLHPDRANENRGAESAVSYLLALTQMREMTASGDERARIVLLAP